MADINLNISESVVSSESAVIEFSALKKEIRNALKSDLLSITMANGYKTTINGVSRKFKMFDAVEKNQMPYVSIVGGLAKYEHFESTPIVTWQVALQVYFHLTDGTSDDEDVLEVEFDKFIDAIHQKFYNDNTVVEEFIRSLEIQESYSDPFHEGDIGVGLATLSIEFAQL